MRGEHASCRANFGNTGFVAAAETSIAMQAGWGMILAASLRFTGIRISAPVESRVRSDLQLEFTYGSAIFPFSPREFSRGCLKCALPTPGVMRIPPPDPGTVVI